MQTAVVYVAGAFTLVISNEGYHRAGLTRSKKLYLLQFRSRFSPSSDLLCFKNIDFAFVSIP